MRGPTIDSELTNKLPLGTSSFEALRETNEIYVDKTDFIYKLASNRGKYFLARPRRFGKSLLISTFESLFKHGLRDFNGLKIENLWLEEKTYHVVRLDFSRVKPDSSFEEFQKYFDSYLEFQFKKIGFEKISGNSFILDQIEFFLSSFTNSSLVLLIDEYDAPLTACLNEPELFAKVRNYLSKFYSIFKSNDNVLRFLFITGITKFNKTSIFSELNNLTDISLSPEYGRLLGYTYEEVNKYFEEYLSNSSDVLKIDKDHLLELLIFHYDGFCFEETARQKVFSPWSLLQFFASPERGLKDYWFESGGRPSVLTKYFKSHSLKNPEEYDKSKSIPISLLGGSSEPDSLSDVGLLTHAGYLTIKKIEGATVYVGYPNLEVKQAMAQLYVEQLLCGKTLEQVGADKISYRLSTENAESVVHLLNRLFNSVDYVQYPIRDEASLRAYVQIFFAGAGLDPIVERHNAHGRSDLEVASGQRLWVFEFKVLRLGEDAEAKLLQAVQQIIERKYAYGIQKKIVLKLALVFSLQHKTFVKWKLC